ncbi:MAG: TonB-dependent receptor [Parvularculaceae bacterium]|nr:TonB-dependent receptor [Parvularculaceae bacterium]
MRALLLAVLAISPLSAVAAEPPDDSLVVTATRVPRPAALVGGTILSAETLERGQFSRVGDALRFVEGVVVAKTGGPGGVETARLRGATAAQTLVVVDGAVVNDPASPQGAYDFSDLLTDDVARIEILRGPQSLLWGADAIGGVVAVETKEARGRALALSAEGGSYGAARAAFSVSAGDSDGTHFRATGTGARIDGFSRAAQGSEADGWRAGSASLRAGLALAEGVRADVSAQYGRSQTDIDGFPPPAFELADTQDTERRRNFLVVGRLRHEGAVDGTATLSFGGLRRRGFDGAGAEAYASTGDRLGASYVARTRRRGAFNLAGGIDAQRTGNRSGGIDARAERAGAFLILDGAFRPAFAPGSEATLSVGGRHDEFSNFKGASTVRVAAAWSFADGTVVRADWGTGFRAPSLFELNYADFGVTPNPDLRPERARGWEIGLEKPFGRTAIREATFVLRASLFEQNSDDLIDFSFASNGYVNVARARSRGVEASADWRPAKMVNLAFAYTLIDAKDLDAGLALLRTPRHRGSAIASFELARGLDVSAALYANGAERDLPADNKAYARLDLRASYRATPRAALYARIENVTDARYQDVSGYGETGLAAYVGTRLRL